MHDDEHPPQEAPRRAVRRDALRNRESLVAGALRALARDGMNEPLAEIAREAGVGVATFYRRFPDRRALMIELEHRAYDKLIMILDAVAQAGLRGCPPCSPSSSSRWRSPTT